MGGGGGGGEHEELDSLLKTPETLFISLKCEVRASRSLWCFVKRVAVNSEVEFWILGEEEEEERVKRKGRRTRRKGRIWIFV